MTAIPYVKKISSNIKKGYSLEFNSNLACLQGKNGAGKSGVIQSIMLALVGEVRDAGFRDRIRDPKMLSELSNGQNLWSHVELSDGTKFSYIYDGKKVTLAENRPVAYELYSLCEEAIQGSTDTLIEFLYTFIACFSGDNKNACLVHFEALLKQSKIKNQNITGYKLRAAELFKQEFLNLNGYLKSIKNSLDSFTEELKESKTFTAYCARLPANTFLSECLDKANKRQRELEEELVFFKLLHSSIRLAMRDVVTACKSNIEDLLNSYYDTSAGKQLVLITEEKRVRLALHDNHTTIDATSLSGFEFVRVAYALACVVASKFDGFKFFVVPDRSYDTHAWHLMEDMFLDAPFQVITQRATIEPKPFTNFNWDVIWLSEQIQKLKYL